MSSSLSTNAGVSNGKQAIWWPAARNEFIAMGRSIAFMSDIGARFPPYIFATDAQGEGEGGLGGYGVAGRYVNSFYWNSVLNCAELSGYTVRRLGDHRGAK